MITPRPASITRRLILWLTGAVVVLWLISTAIALIIMHAELDKSLDSSLQEAAQRLLTLAVESDRGAIGETSVARPHGKIIADHHEYLTYQVRDATGRVLLRSHDAQPQPFAVPLRPGFANTDAFRIYTEGTLQGDLFVQVAETHTHRHEAVFGAGVALALPLMLLVPLSALAIRSIVNNCMAPVLSIQQEISERGSGNLTPIGETEIVSELTPITVAVNRLIGRLRTALEAERAFASNSAHELRTPLASALAQVQRLQTMMSEPLHKERLGGIEHELRRLVDLSEKLLQLSRAEAGVAMSRAQSESNLTPILELIVEDIGRASKWTGREIVVERGEAELRSRMDVDAFGIVVRNLVENALRHGDERGAILVRVEGPRRLRVLNSGPVVAPEVLAELTRRFTRGSTRSEGAGLGLAIVETILRQSGGQLELHSPASGRTDGFEAVVDLG